MARASIPSGTRDFSAETVRKRNYILSVIKNVFEVYGFQPLETPAMENLETLMGKYGEEGDKLIYKILNNGLNDPKNISKANTGFEKLLEGKTTAELTDKALKYDLTIPFARFVAMNHGQLTFPYKRYQVQNVWRADRPQKGRYREFTQCDADIVGSKALLNEIELLNIYHDVFTRLGLKEYEIKINTRAVLTGLAEKCGGSEQMTQIAIAIDKLDKIGPDNVKEELKNRGLTDEQLAFVEQYLNIQGSNSEKLLQLRDFFGESETAIKGMDELRVILDQCRNIHLFIDFTLARGLNYYTGIILEAKAPAEVQIGSIGGGGRYDDLTGLFGVPGVPGVGISFGIDRIYDVLEELNLFPGNLDVGAKALFFNLGTHESRSAFDIMQDLRHNNIACELYHEPAKMDKQFKYAVKKNIPYAVIIGSEEIANSNCIVKDLRTGTQQNIPITELLYFFTNS